MNKSFAFPLTQRKLFGIGVMVACFIIFTILLYHFILFLESYLAKSFAELAPYAYIVVFGTTLITSSLVVLPAPVSLLSLSLALSVAAKGDPLWVILAQSSGSTLGEISAYLVGYFGRIAVGKGEGYQRAERWMRRWGFLAVSFFAFVPGLFLFDIVGITAGALRMPLWQFLTACFIGRLPRSFIEIYTGGEILKFFLSLFD